MKKQLKLGKTPARNLVSFKLSQFADFSQLPKPPKRFGHETPFAPKAWGMLGNDNYGDCVFAGAAHETMLWNKECGKDVVFNESAVLSDYSAVTGFDPNDPYTDQGTDMKQAASYRRKTGIVDANGVRHKIAAYLSIDPGNIQEHYVALYLFGAVGIGILFPGSAMDQFNKGKTWSVVRGTPTPNEGHYIPLVAKRYHLECVTWGQVQPMTLGFLSKYNDESVVYLSESMLTDRKSPEGFDYDTLVKYLNQLK
jgi:hypothetical protein